MTALPPDAVADLYKLVAELEQRLESSFAAHDAAIARAAVIAQENVRLQNELSVARDRQSASADILGTIANASGDAEVSLRRIAETTARLFDAASVTIRIADGNEWGQTIRFGASAERIDALVPAEQRRPGGRNLPGTVFRENRQIHIPDLDNIDPEMADWPVMAARTAGTRTVAGTPLLRGGKAIGAVLVFRDRLALFFGIAFPLIFLFVFGGLGGKNNNVTFRVAFINQSQTASATQLSDTIKKEKVFKESQDNMPLNGSQELSA